MPETAQSDRDQIHHLQITVAHHVDNEFYTLARIMPSSGGAMLDWNAALVADVTHEVPPAALYSAVRESSCATVDGRSSCEHMCVLLDACNEQGDVLDNKEIAIEDADWLLDGQFAERLRAARNDLADFYSAQRS